LSAVVYFFIFMVAIYLLIVVPYRAYMKRRGTSVYGEPAPTKTCPYCLSASLPVAATKCMYCASELPVSS
jgi:large conductance mechanosensitive channel